MKALFGLGDAEHDWRDSIAVLTGIGAWLFLFAAIPFFVSAHWSLTQKLLFFRGELMLLLVWLALCLAVPGVVLGLRGERKGRRLLLPFSAALVAFVMYLHLGTDGLEFLAFIAFTPIAGVVLAARACRRSVSRAAAIAVPWLPMPLAMFIFMAYEFVKRHDVSIPLLLLSGSGVAAGPWGVLMAPLMGHPLSAPWLGIPLALLATALVAASVFVLARKKSPRPWLIIFHSLVMTAWCIIGVIQLTIILRAHDPAAG